MKEKVWFITGASKGFGRILVDKLLAQGQKVAATSRTIEKFADLESKNFIPLAITNLSDAQQVKSAVDKVKAKFGTIDVLVNNAGYGLIGNFEEISDAVLRAQFEVNVFGLMNVTRQVLPVMRHQKSGHIFNISSIAGFVGYDQFSSYNATKFAVDGWTDSLRYELGRFQIKVTSIMPGGYRTEFLDPVSLRAADVPITDYQKIETELNLTGRWAEANHQQIGDPSDAMDILIKTAELTNPPTHLFLGVDALENATAKVEEWKQLIKVSHQLNKVKA